MKTKSRLMDIPDDDDKLNPTDKNILQLLGEGRETTASMAEQLDIHPNTVRDRLKWLREWGYVRYHHKPTGLHELDLGDGTEDEN